MPGVAESQGAGVGGFINLQGSRRPGQAEPCPPRFAKYYRDAAGVEFRTLFKAYGIRFDVMVNGKVCG